MDACPYNHDGIDFQFARIDLENMHPHDAKWIRFKLAIDTYFWPVLAIAAPPLAIAVGFFFFVA